MSAAHGAGLTHPTHTSHLGSGQTNGRFLSFSSPASAVTAARSGALGASTPK